MIVDDIGGLFGPISCPPILEVIHTLDGRRNMRRFVHCFFDWLVGHNYDGISLEVGAKFSRSHYRVEGDLL